MLIIRLQRTGKRNQADFRIVLAEKTAPVEKRFLEVLGSYNPRKKDFKVKEDRLKHWLEQKVEVSATVHNLFAGKGLVQGGKIKAFSIPKKPAEAPTPATQSPAPETAPASEGGAPESADAAPAPTEQPSQPAA